ncbi:MAG: DNA primase [Planctomycetota bacterium]|nr:DNA primase [Planctomycetota bacterium]
MSFSFDVDTKEQVRAATDIVDLIGSRYELRRQGRNYATLCPWHTDTRPSLQIDPNRQTWKCWVCDIGGDVFNFLMQDEGLNFPEALRKLAERAGITLKSKEKYGGKRSQGSSSRQDIKAEIYRALQFADKFYQDFLQSDDGEKAREYLADRQITSASIKQFGIGFAPDSWSAIQDAARQEKITPFILEASGLAKKRDRGGHYDFFRNRVMFPVRDRESRPIAFGGRVLPNSEERAKYLNSSESRVFQKHQTLYGFDVAGKPSRLAKQAIIVEGYTDVIIAHQCGLDTSMAVLGTALTQQHLKVLQRNQVEQVILLLDGDAAGQKRSDDVLELFLHAQMDVRVLTLPEGQDPADFLLANGAEALHDRIRKSGDALEFKLQRVSSGFDPLVDTHRANQAVEEMLSLLAKVPQSGLIENSAFRLRQDQVLARLARKFSIPEANLRERLSGLRKRNERFQRRKPEEDEQSQALMRPGVLSPFERELLELIILAPQVAPIALERVQSGWLECAAARAMLAAYQQLEFAGESLEFESVLVALEDPSLKSLLVTLHEQAQAKLGYTKVSAEDRLRVLTHRMGERQDAVRRLQLETELQKSNLSETEEIGVLEDVIRQARLRQGLVGDPGDEEDTMPPPTPPGDPA